MPKRERLNLGSGADVRQGFVNVDVKAYEGVDVVADIRELTFEPESFVEILAKDVLEHLTFVEAKRLLRNCFEWLKPNGTLTLHMHNMPYLAAELANGGDYDSPFMFEVLKWVYGIAAAGENTDVYQHHHWGYSKDSLSKILRNMGYTVIKAKVDCGGFGLMAIAAKR